NSSHTACLVTERFHETSVAIQALADSIQSAPAILHQGIRQRELRPHCQDRQQVGHRSRTTTVFSRCDDCPFGGVSHDVRLRQPSDRRQYLTKVRSTLRRQLQPVIKRDEIAERSLQMKVVDAQILNKSGDGRYSAEPVNQYIG